MAQLPQTAAPHANAGKNNESPAQAVTRLQKDLKTRIPLARATMLWERAAPRTLPALALTTVFLGSAMAGAWGYIPHESRMIGVGLVSLALAAALAPLRHVRLPTRSEAIDRLEKNTGLPHNPVETILGKAFEPRNKDAERLWDLHQQETAAKIGKFRVGAPDHNLKKHDPFYLLRTLPAFALALGLALGGYNTLDNMAQPFDWTAPPTPVIPARVDAWVTPPQYTRQAPVFLTDQSVVREETPTGSELTAPHGSRMTVRVVGGTSNVTVTGGAIIEKEPAPVDPNAEKPRGTSTTPARPEIREYEIVLHDDATINIEAHGGVVMGWRFAVTPDNAPGITVESVDNPDRPNTVELRYQVNDDYGTISIQTDIVNNEPPKSQSVRPPRPLVPPPQINLPVPR